MEFIKVNTICCNPFRKPGHTVSKGLRNVTNWMCELEYGIVENNKVCDSCRKSLGQIKGFKDSDAEVSDVSLSALNMTDNSKNGFLDRKNAIDLLNAALQEIGESPVKNRKVRTESYCKDKAEKIKKTLIENVLTGVVENSCSDAESEIVQQLKEKFKITTDKKEKFLILTVLPKSWSCQIIQNEFNVSFHMALKAKNLVKEFGILSTPDSKPRHKILEETIQLVKDFYVTDEISRQMPGKKDTKSVRLDDGKREQRQKRMLLANLKEIYAEFKNKYPEERIGFSKFAELKPTECILAGESGTHSVCVCVIHQNVKLILSDTKIKNFVLQGDQISSYRDFLSAIMCQPPSPKCHLNECEKCPGINNVKDKLFKYFENEMIDTITCKQWIISHKSCRLETITNDVEDFVDTFCDQLYDLNRHDFIAKKQAAFYADKKESLAKDEILITLDFAENYSCLIQDAAQSYHWSTPQATIHPMVIYYRKDNQLKHKSITFISNCLNHDAALVYAFQKKLIEYLKGEELFKNVKRISYHSDGAGNQYKNCNNFSNLCHHKEDFNIDAEWHFFATSHGKSACDGVGGTVKRLAAKASLQTTTIRNPTELYQWAVENLKGIKFLYCSAEEYDKTQDELKDRFAKAKTLPGTRKLHSFIPLSVNSIATKIYSYSDKTDVHYAVQ